MNWINTRKNISLYLIGVLLTLLSGSLSAGGAQQEKAPSDEKKAGESRVQSQTEMDAAKVLKDISAGLQKLKKDTVSLNSELRQMEEKLLFPSSTKFTVFISLKKGEFFALESLKLKIDGQQVSSHLYSDKQRQAMARGGIQKLHTTNLSPGKHVVTAFFTGVGINGRAYKLAKTLEFEKGAAGEYLEIAILDNAKTQEPVFKMKRW